MALELPGVGQELDAVAYRLRAAIHKRDRLAEALAQADAEISADARKFADLCGNTVKPTLEQLRRMLAENGKG